MLGWRRLISIRAAVGSALVHLLFAGFCTAAPLQFKPLPSNFDNDFRYHNQFDLTGSILFTASIGSFERILELNFASKRIVKIIDGPGNNSSARYSPDGKKIVFVSDRDGNKEIYIADVDGSNPRRMTTTSSDEDHPSWSPDGLKILFSSRNAKSGSNIFLLDLESGAKKQLTKFSGRNSTPQLSPDGNSLAYTTDRFWPGWDICIFNLKSGSENCPLSGTITYFRPAWSYDGKWLAFSTGTATIDGKIMNLASGSVSVAAQTPGDDYDMDWTGDNKHIVFSSDQSNKGVYNIYIASLATGESGKISISPVLKSSHSLRYPDWHAQ